MNDPGLDEPIRDASNIVKENVEDPLYKFHGRQDDSLSHSPNPAADDSMDEEEQERNFLMPARWWYASTAIPLVAGTFGPMANAFSICALVENWRVEIPEGGTEEHGIDIKDPPWLIAINGVSLVCAIVANMSLLLNMARRVPFKIAQPITIVGFWVASVLLIALIAYAAHDFHALDVPNQALSQAYYYAIFAASLYQIIAYLMCVTVYGAYRGHFSKEFKLTIAQRTLMLQTISFLVYQLLGALVFSHVEGWKYLDAVYWADFTSLTIGIGADYVPTTHLGRSLLFPFAIGGIIILGLVVGSIRSLILERGKKKLAARLTEKTRARLVKRIEQLDKKKSFFGRKAVMGLEKDKARALTTEPGDEKMSEVERRQTEFEAMRRVQERAAVKRKYMSLAISTFAWAFLWIIGALVFSVTEKNQKWTYFDSLYFAYTSLLTIGYGDFQPISNSGKPFFVFWSLLAVPTLTILISDMGDTVVKSIKDITIWLGEITVLPSDEDSVRNRLRHGIYKATLGKVDSRRQAARDVEEGSDLDGGSGIRELHPGLLRIFRNGAKHGEKVKGSARNTSERLAADFEQSEARDESIARDRGEKWEEDEHHYRRELISSIRKVYADTSAATPKKYTYQEWAGFLKLLGEDEHDASYHKRAPTLFREEAIGVEQNGSKHAHSAAQRQQDFEISGQEAAYVKGHDKDSRGTEAKATKWSWIGNRSPLMGDKEEAEWLLEKFFQRLEESMSNAGRKTSTGAMKETGKGESTNKASEETVGRD